MPANSSTAHSPRSTVEAESAPRAGSSPPRTTEDLQPRRWRFRLPRPDRRPAPSDAPRMDWLQALIVAGGAAVLAYHVGFRHGRDAAPDSESPGNEAAAR